MSTGPGVLIAFGTSYGHTAKIADRIAEQLSRRGARVTVARVDRLAREQSPESFDAVILGASLIVGGYQRYVRRFAKKHAETLNRLPSGFFAVSGSAGSADPDIRAEAVRIMETFLERTGWTPAVRLSVAGAIPFTKYNPLVRWVMKRISAKSGGSTDTSRDHEYTDWAEVDRFAERFADLVTAEPRTVEESHDDMDLAG